MTKARKLDSDLEREIGALADFSRAELIERWQALYRNDPPKGLSRHLLIFAIAYRMQVKRYGGLKAAAKRKLEGSGGGDATQKESKSRASIKLPSGARLVREWNGVTHVVDVADGHFVWNGERHHSLSAIARAITGARWSGPRFFGLTREGGS
jgi:hypothetical protein